MEDSADVEAGVAEVGKEAGKDEDKCNSIDLHGIEGARLRARQLQDEGCALLKKFGPRAEWLRVLIQEASWKTK